MTGGGVQREVLASLALVMITANGLLAAVLLRAFDLHADTQVELVQRALLAESRLPEEERRDLAGSGRQWMVVRPGANEGVPPAVADIAAASLEAGEALAHHGYAWEPTLFAAPGVGGSVAVARIDPVVPRAALVALMLADALVFLGAGAYLLRRRLIVPLQTLAAAVDAMGRGGVGVRAGVRGSVAEVEQLGVAFDEMADALERRTGELEKAVVDLRGSNRELRHAREGLDRAERLAAVGTLAAGVAHEVGNPMGAVLAFLDLTRREAETHGFSERGKECIAKAMREGDRVRTILRQLLDFSRPPAPELRPIDLAQVAERSASLVRAQAEYRDLRIEVESEPGLPAPMADESVTSQILLNLVLNAAHAVAASGGERIRLRIERCSLELRAGDTGRGAALVARRQPDGVVCHVEDDGPGIPEPERDRVFDPFFTTKPPGEGTGLGLANALRLAEEQGGRIDVDESRELGGARVSLVMRASIDLGGERPDASEPAVATRSRTP